MNGGHPRVLEKEMGQPWKAPPLWFLVPGRDISDLSLIERQYCASLVTAHSGWSLLDSMFAGDRARCGFKCGVRMASRRCR
jgi:hypothetical protein